MNKIYKILGLSLSCITAIQAMEAPLRVSGQKTQEVKVPLNVFVQKPKSYMNILFPTMRQKITAGILGAMSVLTLLIVLKWRRSPTPKGTPGTPGAQATATIPVPTAAPADPAAANLAPVDPALQAAATVPPVVQQSAPAPVSVPLVSAAPTPSEQITPRNSTENQTATVSTVSASSSPGDSSASAPATPTVTQPATTQQAAATSSPTKADKFKKVKDIASKAKNNFFGLFKKEQS